MMNERIGKAIRHLKQRSQMPVWVVYLLSAFTGALLGILLRDVI